MGERGVEDGEGEKDIAHLLCHCPNTHNSWGWTRLKSSASKSIWIYPMDGRDPGTCAIKCCPIGCMLIGKWNQKRRWDLTQMLGYGCRLPKKHLNCQVKHFFIVS